MAKLGLNLCFLSLALMLVPSHLAAEIMPMRAMQKLVNHESLTVQEKRNLRQTVGAVMAGLLAIGAGVAGFCVFYKKCFKLGQTGTGFQDEATETDQSLIGANQGSGAAESIGSNPPPAPVQPGADYRGTRLPTAEPNQPDQQKNPAPAATPSAFAYIPLNGTDLNRTRLKPAGGNPRSSQPVPTEKSEAELAMARSQASRKAVYTQDGKPNLNDITVTWK